MMSDQQWFCPESTRPLSPYDLGDPSNGGWITEDPWSADCEPLKTRDERATEFVLLTAFGPVLFVLKSLSPD